MEGKMNEQETSEEQPIIDSEQVNYEYAIQQLREKENFPLAIIAGLLAAALGAAIWAGFTVITEYQVGVIAIGVGFLVAFSIRFAGKGLSIKFQILGALLSLLGCAVGNFFTICYYIAQNESLGLFEVLTLINPAAIPELMTSTFSAMDVVFYGIAIYEGFRLSVRQITESDLVDLQCAALSNQKA